MAIDFNFYRLLMYYSIFILGKSAVNTSTILNFKTCSKSKFFILIKFIT